MAQSPDCRLGVAAVYRSQDPTAPDPEIQRQAARIRTDMDRFSELEISALVQHGYCVARKLCREQDLLSANIPSGEPWDPLAEVRQDGETAVRRLSDENQVLSTAHQLRHSSARRIWRTLLNFRDWPSYVWILLLACVTLTLPYALYKANKRAHQQRIVLTAIAETSPVYRKILDLLEHGPVQLQRPAGGTRTQAWAV